MKTQPLHPLAARMHPLAHARSYEPKSGVRFGSYERERVDGARSPRPHPTIISPTAACLRTISLAIAAVVLITAAPAAPAPAASTAWKVGLASAKITPDKPLMLAGYAARNRPFDRVEDDLFAKAMAFDDGQGNRGVIVTSDVLGFVAEVSEPICDRLHKSTGLRREQIVLNSSHTHTGPTLSLNDKPRGFFTAEAARNTAAYTRWLQDQVVALVEQAVRDLAPARLGWSVGLTHFAVSRREFTPKTVKLGVNPRGLVDRSVPVLRIDGADGKPRAVLFGYACHNTTLSQTDFMVSADYAGYAQAFVQQEFPGVQAMFVIGCAGDANPYPRGTLEIAREHGVALGREVTRVLATPLQPVNGPLRCVLGRVELPVGQTPRSELERMLAKGNVREKETATKMLATLDSGQPQPTAYSAPIAVWQFGSDLTFVGLSGEVVVDYVPLIEKAIGPLNLWISSYCNDVYGYLPSARVIAEGGYEARGLFAINGLFKPEAEAALVNKVRELAVKAGRPMPE